MEKVQKDLQPTDAVKMVADMIEEEEAASDAAEVDKMADMIAKMTDEDAKKLKEKLFPSTSHTSENHNEDEDEDEDEGEGEDENEKKGENE